VPLSSGAAIALTMMRFTKLKNFFTTLPMTIFNLSILLLEEFAVIFFFILILGYLVPRGRAYYLFFFHFNEEKDSRRIQDRRPTPQSIRREI